LVGVVGLLWWLPLTSSNSRGEVVDEGEEGGGSGVDSEQAEETDSSDSGGRIAGSDFTGFFFNDGVGGSGVGSEQHGEETDSSDAGVMIAGGDCKCFFFLDSFGGKGGLVLPEDDLEEEVEQEEEEVRCFGERDDTLGLVVVVVRVLFLLPGGGS
jgi:hypothetical protein